MKACILDQSFSTLIFATNPSDPILNTFRLLHEDGFGKRYEWIASIDAPTSQAVGNGKKKNKIILSPPLSQLSATLPSIHPIPSWALPHELFFRQKPASASLPEFRYLLQSALLPAATDTINTLYTPLCFL